MPTTPTGLSLEEALKVQQTNAPTQDLPPEGQLFTLRGGFGGEGNAPGMLFKRVGNQILQVDPTGSLLTEQERQQAGSRGAQIGLTSQRLKAQGIDVNTLPQYAFPGEALAKISGQSVGDIFAQGDITQFLPNLKTDAGGNTLVPGDLLSTVTATDPRERLQQLLGVAAKMGVNVSGGATPAAVVGPTLAANQTGKPAPTVAGVTNISSLYNNVAMTALEEKIKTQSAEIAAGLATGGRTKILEDLFIKYGVQTETKTVNDLNALILEKQQRLRAIPDDIKKGLQDVGVTQGQLNRLIERETHQPIEDLRGLLEQKGAAADKINQALKFVGLFADAQLQDQAAKIEATKFDYETNKDLLSRLDKRQQEFVKLALDEQKDNLTLRQDLAKGGAPQAVRDDAANLTRDEILSKYGNYLVKPDTSPQVIGTQETGYFQYNPTTQKFEKITNIQARPPKLTESEKKVEALVSLYSDDYDNAIKQGATPQEALEAVRTIAVNRGDEIDPITAQRLLQRRVIIPQLAPTAEEKGAELQNQLGGSLFGASPLLRGLFSQE